MDHWIGQQDLRLFLGEAKDHMPASEAQPKISKVAPSTGPEIAAPSLIRNGVAFDQLHTPAYCGSSASRHG